jgi:hypothetical protein
VGFLVLLLRNQGLGRRRGDRLRFRFTKFSGIWRTWCFDLRVVRQRLQDVADRDIR